MLGLCRGYIDIMERNGNYYNVGFIYFGFI